MTTASRLQRSGIAFAQLTVNDLRRAIVFYEKVLAHIGMKAVVKASNLLYMVGARSGVTITQSSVESWDHAVDQRTGGLHHLCFRARSRSDVDALHAFLLEHREKVIHAPEEGLWAPGSYSLRFEDPEGICLEACFVPSNPAAETGWLR